MVAVGSSHTFFHLIRQKKNKEEQYLFGITAKPSPKVKARGWSKAWFVAKFLLILGLVFLLSGGAMLVRGASMLAAQYGVSPLLVGLTVVAFGTSVPDAGPRCSRW